MSCVGCAIAPYHTIDKDNIARFVVAARAASFPGRSPT